MKQLRFDMRSIGQTIARLRRERNMTQMALADQMNVSYQAVSNWERGQSMPDVSKLPELAELLGTTIDELLGRSVTIITHAAQGTLSEYMQAQPISIREISDAAPILSPDQIDQLTDRLMGMTDSNQTLDNTPDAEEITPSDNVRFDDLTGLLPFLSTEKIDQLLRDRVSRGESIDAFLPFASNGMLEALARKAETNGDEDRLLDLLPFLRYELLDEIADARLAAGSISDIVPFLRTETVNRIALERLRRGESIHDLLPFIGQRLLDQLTESASNS